MPWKDKVLLKRTSIVCKRVYQYSPHTVNFVDVLMCDITDKKMFRRLT